MPTRWLDSQCLATYICAMKVEPGIGLFLTAANSVTITLALPQSRKKTDKTMTKLFKIVQN